MSIKQSKIWVALITVMVVMYWVLVLLIVVSCSSDTDAIETERLPITFGLQSATTRADTEIFADGSIPVGQKIGVFAYEQRTATWDSSEHAPSMMYNQWMEVGEGNTLSYFPLHYWPNNKAGEVEEKLTFVAYYPYSTTHSGDHGVMIDQTDISKGHAKMEFRQYEKASEQTDLMISEWIHDRSRSSEKPLFSFKHMLAKVTISIERVTPTKVTLKHVGMSAYIDFLSDTPSWNVASMKYGTTTIDNFSDNKPILLMIPQSTDDISITVEYNGTSKTGTLPSGSWAKGQSYEYHITIN